MKIFKIEIENFRLLKNFSIDIENELSLVIGKNNTGKTSLLAALDKCLNQVERSRFTFDDFNIFFKKKLIDLVELEEPQELTSFNELGIKVRLFIEYFTEDDLSNIRETITDLDPAHRVVVLSFEYVLNHDFYIQLRDDNKKLLEREKKKKQENPDYIIRTLHDFLRVNYNQYFKFQEKTIGYNIDTEKIIEDDWTDLSTKNVKIYNIINFKYINAKRDVTNKESNRTLSGQTARIYKRTDANDDKDIAIEGFKDTLAVTDSQLSSIYKTIFSDIIDNVKNFGGLKKNESEIEIISTLKHQELLEGNTTIVYKHDEDNNLPEHYNGLGYMNLISMIFEIEILIREFKREKEKEPSDINLLFIEEPEAHTHPQMQYIFIRNIKRLLKKGILREGGAKRDLQYIISTHSAHIVADSDFDDIKYLKKESNNGVIAKKLKDLEEEYGGGDDEKKSFRFLKQYLTINRAELFFADKAIFIEGETEKVLLPAMMKKIDQEFPENPLLSQNISVIEVGAHSHIFEKFIHFIGIQKVLIITDIDSYYEEEILDEKDEPKKHKNGKIKYNTIKCEASDESAQYTSNYSLIFFHGSIDLDYYKKLELDKKALYRTNEKVWKPKSDGTLFIAYQTEEKKYHARSFEDAFFHINREFILNESFIFLIKKHVELYRENKIGPFDFSEKAVGKKPPLAIEILLNSKIDDDGNEFSNWQVPAYIKEGLLWLKDD
jgi:predicted ATP-dependent endonuclease of OLD family